jgi:hypothetical protein
MQGGVQVKFLLFLIAISASASEIEEPEIELTSCEAWIEPRASLSKIVFRVKNVTDRPLQGILTTEFHFGEVGGKMGNHGAARPRGWEASLNPGQEIAYPVIGASAGGLPVSCPGKIFGFVPPKLAAASAWHGHRFQYSCHSPPKETKSFKQCAVFGSVALAVGNANGLAAVAPDTPLLERSGKAGSCQSLQSKWSAISLPGRTCGSSMRYYKALLKLNSHSRVLCDLTENSAVKNCEPADSGAWAKDTELDSEAVLRFAATNEDWQRGCRGPLDQMLNYYQANREMIHKLKKGQAARCER